MNKELREKMKESAEDLYPSCVYRDEERASFIAGSEAMYAELSPIVEWVSVKDRLPKENETVLIKEIGYLGKPYINIVRGWEENRFGKDADITHWRKIEL